MVVCPVDSKLDCAVLVTNEGYGLGGCVVIVAEPVEKWETPLNRLSRCQIEPVFSTFPSGFFPPNPNSGDEAFLIIPRWLRKATFRLLSL